MASLTLFLVIACLFDYREHRIPNLLILIMSMVCLGVNLYSGGTKGAALSATKAFIVIIALYPLFKIGILGAGDVKLFGVCVGYISPHKILFFLFVSFLIAAIFSLLKMLKEQNAIERFVYFCEYLMAVIHNKKWQLYMEEDKEKIAGSICLAGPILCSVLLCWGGIY